MIQPKQALRYLTVLMLALATFWAVGCKKQEEKPSAPGYYTGPMVPKNGGPAVSDADRYKPEPNR